MASNQYIDHEIYKESTINEFHVKNNRTKTKLIKFFREIENFGQIYLKEAILSKELMEDTMFS